MQNEQLTFDQADGFSPALDPDLSQWHTPVRLACRMVELCGDVEGKVVIEPCAGAGNLIAQLITSGALVDAYEIDERWVEMMAARFRGVPNVILNEGDFLQTYSLNADLVVMNPPFEDGLDGRFIAKAIEVAPRVITVLRTHALHGVRRQLDVWSKVHVATLALLVRRPKFGPGDGAKHEFCVADIRRKSDSAGMTELQWWDL